MQVSTYAFHNANLNHSGTIPILAQDFSVTETKCYQCETRITPQWRVGPRGVTLCNAHGLRITQLRKRNPQVDAFLKQVEADPQLHSIKEIFKKIAELKKTPVSRFQGTKKKKAKASAFPNQLTLKITKISQPTINNVFHLHFYDVKDKQKTIHKPFSINGKVPVDSLLN